MPRAPRFVFALVLAGAALLAAGSLAGCDSRDEDEGRFEADVGYVGSAGGRRFEGRALATETDADDPFTIELVPRSSRTGLREQFLFTRAEGGRPQPGGVYSFAPPSDGALPGGGRFAGALLIAFGNATPSLYYVANGYIEFDGERGDGRLGGFFEFTASLASPGGTVDAPQSVIVNGTFVAESGGTDNFPL